MAGESVNTYFLIRDLNPPSFHPCARVEIYIQRQGAQSEQSRDTGHGYTERQEERQNIRETSWLMGKTVFSSCSLPALNLENMSVCVYACSEMVFWSPRLKKSDFF